MYPVPEGASPYEVKDNTYENPWLGLKLVKPAGFTLSNLDALWPDRTVLAFEGPSGEVAVLDQDEFYPWEEAENAAWEKLENSFRRASARG